MTDREVRTFRISATACDLLILTAVRMDTLQKNCPKAMPAGVGEDVPSSDSASIWRLFFVLGGIGLVAGLLILSRQPPSEARQMWLGPVVSLAFGGFLTWTVRRSLQTGVAQGQYRQYERSDSPVSFWLCVISSGAVAVVFIAFGICGVFAPDFMRAIGVWKNL
jgi:hypothetical protein